MDNILLTLGINSAPALSQLDRELSAFERKRNLKFNFDTGSLTTAKNSLNDFDHALTRVQTHFLAFAASAATIGLVTRAIEDSAKAFVAVDLALTRININLNTSQANLQKFGNSLFDIAKKTGQSFEEVAKAATIFSQQGNGVAATIDKTRAALTLMRQSGLDLEDSVEAITATLQEFRKESLNAIDVVDKFASVEGKFAVSSKTLAEAFTRVGASAESAGISSNQLVGIITSVAAATQASGPRIATFLNSLLNNEQKQGTIEQFKQLGIQVEKIPGTFLPGIQIIQNIAQKYDALTKASGGAATAQKEQIVQLVGGSRNLNLLNALLNDVTKSNGVYAQSLNVVANAQDAAAKKNDELNKSFGAQINVAAQNLEQLAAKVGSLTLAPLFNRTVGNFNSIAKLLGDNSGSSAEKLGKDLGAGILKGIGSALAGPGLVIGGVVLAKLVGQVGKYATDALGGLLKSNTAAEQQENLQKSITSILQQQPQIYKQILALGNDEVAQKKIILDLLKQQAAVQIGSTALTNTLAASAYGSGARSNGGRISFKADGFSPELAAAISNESSATSRNVGGGAGGKPVVVPNFSIGGQPQTIVANDREYFVPTSSINPSYSGPDKVSILNPQMIASMGGLPNGATPVKGSVPHFAHGLDIISQLTQGSNLLGGAGVGGMVGAAGLGINYLRDLFFGERVNSTGSLYSKSGFSAKGGPAIDINQLISNKNNLADFNSGSSGGSYEDRFPLGGDEYPTDIPDNLPSSNVAQLDHRNLRARELRVIKKLGLIGSNRVKSRKKRGLLQQAARLGLGSLDNLNKFEIANLINLHTISNSGELAQGGLLSRGLNLGENVDKNFSVLRRVGFHADGLVPNFAVGDLIGSGFQSNVYDAGSNVFKGERFKGASQNSTKRGLQYLGGLINQDEVLKSSGIQVALPSDPPRAIKNLFSDQKGFFQPNHSGLRHANIEESLNVRSLISAAISRRGGASRKGFTSFTLGDLKEDNILIDKNGKPIVIDLLANKSESYRKILRGKSNFADSYIPTGYTEESFNKLSTQEQLKAFKKEQQILEIIGEEQKLAKIEKLQNSPRLKFNKFANKLTGGLVGDFGIKDITSFLKENEIPDIASQIAPPIANIPKETLVPRVSRPRSILYTASNSSIINGPDGPRTYTRPFIDDTIGKSLYQIAKNRGVKGIRKDFYDETIERFAERQGIKLGSLAPNNPIVSLPPIFPPYSAPSTLTPASIFAGGGSPPINPPVPPSGRPPSSGSIPPTPPPHRNTNIEIPIGVSPFLLAEAQKRAGNATLPEGLTNDQLKSFIFSVDRSSGVKTPKSIRDFDPANPHGITYGPLEANTHGLPQFGPSPPPIPSALAEAVSKIFDRNRVGVLNSNSSAALPANGPALKDNIRNEVERANKLARNPLNEGEIEKFVEEELSNNAAHYILTAQKKLQTIRVNKNSIQQKIKELGGVDPTALAINESIASGEELTPQQRKQFLIQKRREFLNQYDDPEIRRSKAIRALGTEYVQGQLSLISQQSKKVRDGRAATSNAGNFTNSFINKYGGFFGGASGKKGQSEIDNFIQEQKGFGVDENEVRNHVKNLQNEATERASQVRNQRGLGFAFAAPILSGAITGALGNSISENTKNNINGVTNSLSTGGTIAAIGGFNPLSLGIAGAVTSIGLLKTALDNLGPSVTATGEAYQKSLDKENDNQKNLDAYTQSFSKIQDLKEAGASPSVIKSAIGEQASIFSSLDPNIQKQVLGKNSLQLSNFANQNRLDSVSRTSSSLLDSISAQLDSAGGNFLTGRSNTKLLQSYGLLGTNGASKNSFAGEDGANLLNSYVTALTQKGVTSSDINSRGSNGIRSKIGNDDFNTFSNLTVQETFEIKRALAVKEKNTKTQEDNTASLQEETDLNLRLNQDIKRAIDKGLFQRNFLAQGTFNNQSKNISALTGSLDVGADNYTSALLQSQKFGLANTSIRNQAGLETTQAIGSGLGELSGLFQDKAYDKDPNSTKLGQNLISGIQSGSLYGEDAIEQLKNLGNKFDKNTDIYQKIQDILQKSSESIADIGQKTQQQLDLNKISNDLATRALQIQTQKNFAGGLDTFTDPSKFSSISAPIQSGLSSLIFQGRFNTPAAALQRRFGALTPQGSISSARSVQATNANFGRSNIALNQALTALSGGDSGITDQINSFVGGKDSNVDSIIGQRKLDFGSLATGALSNLNLQGDFSSSISRLQKESSRGVNNLDLTGTLNDLKGLRVNSTNSNNQNSLDKVIGLFDILNKEIGKVRGSSATQLESDFKRSQLSPDDQAKQDLINQEATSTKSLIDSNTRLALSQDNLNATLKQISNLNGQGKDNSGRIGAVTGGDSIGVDAKVAVAVAVNVAGQLQNAKMIEGLGDLVKQYILDNVKPEAINKAAPPRIGAVTGG